MFPEFLPGYDAVASLAKLLELLAPVNRPLSELVAELPEPTLVHHQVPCPWALKGLVMRVLNERLAGRDVDLTDGIKVFDERGWAQVLPDPDEPLIHLYAEGETREASDELARELRALVERDRAGRGRRSPHLAPFCSSRGQRLKFSFTLDRKGLMEPLPDLATLSDEDLKKLIDELTREEQEVSYRRRLLHGKIDILRAELVARLQETQGRASSTPSTSTR